MKTGTSHFTSLGAAIRYYAEYEPDCTHSEVTEHVGTKIGEGLIHIGKPALKPGEVLSVIDGGARYAIESPEVVSADKIVLTQTIHSGLRAPLDGALYINLKDIRPTAPTGTLCYVSKVEGDIATCWNFNAWGAYYEDQVPLSLLREYRAVAK